MDLSKIISISGRPGLNRLIAHTKSGAIVESMLDKKRFPAFGTDRISSLEEISLYSEDEDIPLKDVFKAIYNKESGGKSINPKSSGEELKRYLEEVVPNYDKERVYVSDIKKVISWYNLLHDQNILDFTEEEKEETTEHENEIEVKKTSEEPAEGSVEE